MIAHDPLTPYALQPGESEVDDLPIRVAPDWDEKLARAEELCRLVDRHLDFEARGRILRQRQDFRPEHLGPEQRVQMVSDCYAVTG